MAARPTVTVQGLDGQGAGSVPLPGVMTVPIRHDIIKYAVANITKNKRQAHGISRRAGHQHSAESWGTGRAVSRIPRVSGGGTHAVGAGAFGNMARGGHMFSMTKTFRRWHVAVPRKIRRAAVASAIAATAVAPLVAARGHKIDNLPEIPLVVSDALEKVAKTKQALAVLKAVGVSDDVLRVRSSVKVRAGKGKMRNRRYITRKGPLVVVKDAATARGAFRNIPGVKAVSVSALNVLDLAPGGHIGRLVVWSKSAFEELDAIYGTTSDKACPKKAKFHLPRPLLANADITTIAARDEIQSVLRPKKSLKTRAIKNVNPLKNKRALAKLDPVAGSVAAQARAAKKLKGSRESRRRLKLKTLRAAIAKTAAKK